MKIIASRAHKRWIYLGLLSQNDKNCFTQKPIKIVTTNKILSSNDNSISFVLLDGINAIGKNYSQFIQLLESNSFKEIYVVGDAILNNSFFKKYKNIKLLFYQDFYHNKDVFKKLTIGKRIKYNILPGLFYFAKDVINNSSFVLDLIKMPKTILFAGQTGKHSVVNLFINHIDNDFEESKLYFDNYIEACFNDCDKSIENNNTIENLVTIIIETSNKLKTKLDETKIAIDQTEFEFERYTVIFKSVLRFVIISHLKHLNLLKVIPYPDYYVRLYHSEFYRKHLLIDFGGVNGYESLYPRTADIILNNLHFYQFDQNNMKLCQQNLNSSVLSNYLTKELFKLIKFKNQYGN